MRQGLFDDGSKVQFAGHETFPLRLLWLKKAYDAVDGGAAGRNIPGTGGDSAPSAWAATWRPRCGTGRSASRVHAESATACSDPTRLGDAVLADGGLDPYLEDAATVWLAHWHVASTRRNDDDRLLCLQRPHGHRVRSRRPGRRTARARNRARLAGDPRNAEARRRGVPAQLRPARGTARARTPPSRCWRSSVWCGRRVSADGTNSSADPSPPFPMRVFAYALDEFWERRRRHRPRSRPSRSATRRARRAASSSSTRTASSRA